MPINILQSFSNDTSSLRINIVISEHGCILLGQGRINPSQQVSRFAPHITDMRRLTTGIHSEKCVVRRFRRCADVIQCTYTNLDITV